MDDNVLVSCTVVSYNSSKTILETLESIKAQTYNNIELIVSDDCSTDNTVELCRAWIAQNKDRFVRTELITVEHNTGVSANGNRAIKACRGEWQKGIAADDKLLPNCVEDFMIFVTKHPDAKWISSYIRRYNETFEEKNCVASLCVTSRTFFDKNAQEQLLVLALHNVIFAPSLFFNLAFKKEIGYDTSYLHEDLPFYVNALEKGHKCFFLDKETVCYRIHQSLSNSSEKLFNYNSLIEFRRYRKARLFKYLSKKQIKGQYKLWKMQDRIEKWGINRNTPLLSWAYNKYLALNNRLYS